MSLQHTDRFISPTLRFQRIIARCCRADSQAGSRVEGYPGLLRPCCVSAGPKGSLVGCWCGNHVNTAGRPHSSTHTHQSLNRCEEKAALPATMSLPHVIAPAALQRQPGLMHRQGGRPAWMARPAAPVRLQRRARPTQCQSHPAAGPAALLQRAQAGALQAGLSALAALVLACQPAAAVETVQGPARTVDGDTLEVRGGGGGGRGAEALIWRCLAGRPPADSWQAETAAAK